MKKQLYMVLALSFLASACSWMPEMPSMSSLNPFSSTEEKTPEVEVKLGVNPYLWQASLNKLSFMPLASTDSTGGIIVTEWANMDGISSEQFKITVHILCKDLRADGVKVVVFKRILENGKWVDVSADKRLANEIEKSILVQARELFRRNAAAV